MNKIYPKIYPVKKNASKGLLGALTAGIIIMGKWLRFRVETSQYDTDHILWKSDYLGSHRSSFQTGFTLIELLVVMLIIGILAAVALPQYRMAVEKARAVEAIAWGRRLADAEEAYYLANGSYTNDFDALGVRAPELKYFSVWLETNADVRLQSKSADKYELRFFLHFPSSTGAEYASKQLCQYSKPMGEKICRALCASFEMQDYAYVSGAKFCYLQ